jgi:hypothetical protein
MGNDKLLKTAADMDALGIRSADLEAITSTQRAVAETMRSFERSGLREAIELLTRQQDAMQDLLKPMEDIARAPTLLADSSLLRELNRTQELVAAFESQYPLPALADIGTIAAVFETSSISKALASFVEDRSGLQRAMEQMATPWLDVQETVRSVTAFAEMQGMGRALESLGSFEKELSVVLRTGLGDWRDPIAWQPEVLLDLDRRADFYTGLGFNHDLTALPPPAFAETLEISGLRRERPTLVVLYGVPVPLSDDEVEEDDFDRTRTAYDWLHRLETQLRRFIDRCMTEAFGLDWPRHRLPNRMHDQWQDKKRKASEGGSAERPLIAYADFTDYALIICRADNWREIFQPFFRRPENVRESFQRLHPIRLDTMHSRPITQDDELLLYVEARRLMKMILGN